VKKGSFGLPLESRDISPITISARPYPFFLPKGRAQISLVVIDMQRDFLEHGGFGEILGNKVENLQECVPMVSKLLQFFRKENLPIVHTLEAHEPNLSDCPPSKLIRGIAPGQTGRLKIGDEGPMGRILVRGEPGNEIIPQLKPIEGELVIYKPGKGAFYNTDLQKQLNDLGITHLIFTGVTTEVCVQTSMREANDRGFECLLVEDATASYFPEFKESAISMIRAQGGIVGWTAPGDSVIEGLSSK